MEFKEDVLEDGSSVYRAEFGLLTVSISREGARLWRYTIGWIDDPEDAELLWHWAARSRPLFSTPKEAQEAAAERVWFLLQKMVEAMTLAMKAMEYTPHCLKGVPKTDIARILTEDDF